MSGLVRFRSVHARFWRVRYLSPELHPLPGAPGAHRAGVSRHQPAVPVGGPESALQNLPALLGAALSRSVKLVSGCRQALTRNSSSYNLPFGSIF